MRLLLKLLDPSYNPLGEHFLKFFRSLKGERLKRTELRKHLEAKGLKKCKMHAYELLRIYSQDNFDFSPKDMFSDPEHYRNFKRWLDSKSFSSTGVEKYPIIQPKNIFYGKGSDFVLGKPSKARRVSKQRGVSKHFDSL